MKLQKVLNHKYFLYAAYALMVVNLLGYVSVSSMECIVVFALATYLCKYCMSKNQGLCIFVGLFTANVLLSCWFFDCLSIARTLNFFLWRANAASEPISPAPIIKKSYLCIFFFI